MTWPLLLPLWLSPGLVTITPAAPVQESPLIAVTAFPATLGAPAWPEPPSRMELMSLELALSHDLIERFCRSAETSLVEDIGDMLLRGPESILDGALGCLSGLFPRSAAFSEREGSPPCLTERIFDIHQGRREGRIFTEFMSAWIDREQRFFSKYAADSGIDTSGVERG